MSHATIMEKESILYIYDYKYYNSVLQLEKLRTKQNFNVLLFCVKTPKTCYSLKEYIHFIYNKYNLKYVVLIGSVEEIPTFMKKGINESNNKTLYNKNVYYASSDTIYGMISNSKHSNNNSEGSMFCNYCNSRYCYGKHENACINTWKYKIIIGRLTPGDNFVYSTKELSVSEKIQNIQNQVDKILSYESFIDSKLSGLSDDNWSQSLVGIASNEGKGAGINGLADNEYMRQELEKYHTYKKCNFTELYKGNLAKETKNPLNSYDETGDPNEKHFVDCVNNGCSLLLYAGHANEVSLSTTGFSNKNIHLLNNHNKYFLGCVVGCSFGSHDEDYMSLSENLQVSKDKGSIAMFVSTVLQSWLPPMYMQRKLNDTIIHSDETKTIGELFQIAVTDKTFYKSKDFWYYQILGDPSTRFVLTAESPINNSLPLFENDDETTEDKTKLLKPISEDEEYFDVCEENEIINKHNVFYSFFMYFLSFFKK